MPIAGYSGTALEKKIGIKEDTRLLLVHPPAGYLDLLPAGISQQLCEKEEQANIIHLFATHKKSFESEMIRLGPVCKNRPTIVIWVSWYKKSSGKQTDLTEDIIRSYALSHGLVDVKVCAIDQDWSGLKLVVPLSRR